MSTPYAPRRFTIALVALLSLGLAGCSSSSDTDTGATSDRVAPTSEGVAPTSEAQEQKPDPVSLDGEWKQTNPNDPDRFQTATIAGGTIEVYWNAPDAKSLYWAGSVEVPGDGSDSFSWDSVNDTTKTENALLASDAPTKTFTFENGELSYEVTALGATTTVRLGR